MRFKIITLISMLIAGNVLAQPAIKNNRPKQFAGDQRVLFTVGDKPVTVDEFTYIYSKNNPKDSLQYTEKDLREYLDLFVNFKLRVQDAYAQGLDSTAAFHEEYKKYRNQIAQPYLTDRTVNEKLIDEAYNRLKYEVRAAHILILVKENASPADTLKAYNKIKSIRDSIIAGKVSFEEAARHQSEDPSVASNGGDLGYFTALTMIYPFENAAYNLNKVGQISPIVRTRFGYHIIELKDKRPARGEIQVRHIMITSNPNDNLAKQTQAKAKIDSLYSLLQKGVPFTEVARQFSDHIASRASGGELPPISSFSNYPESFKDAAFALKQDGDYSEPFRSDYGWHIVQRIKLNEIKSKSDMTSSLRERIERDSRSDRSKEAAIAKFKKDLDYKEEKKVTKLISKNIADSSLTKAKFRGLTSTKKENAPLFRLSGKTYTLKDFADWLKVHSTPGSYRDKNMAIKEYFNAFVNEKVLSVYDNQLETRFPDFANISKEYKEGLLLYDVKEKMVWTPAINDTAGQKKYYVAHRDSFMFGQRAEAIIIDLKNQSSVPKVVSLLKQMDVQPKAVKSGIKAKPLTIDSIASLYVIKDPLSFNYVSDVYERGQKSPLDAINPWKVGVYTPGEFANRFYVVKITKVLAPVAKPFDDVRGVVISQMQDEIEANWLSRLRKQYPVQVNEKVLQSLIIK